METLLRQGLKRLAGRDTQAVFELKQEMGSGKTHSMVALGLLARDASLHQQTVPQIAADAPFDHARVVAVNGRLGFEEHFLWGEVAIQLGKGAAFARYWKDGPKAPSEKDWIDLIGDQPVLILLDELPPYFDYAITRSVGGGTLAQVATFALSNLLSAALKLKRCCIVISNLAGTYAGATKQLSQAIYNMQQEAIGRRRRSCRSSWRARRFTRSCASGCSASCLETGDRCRRLSLRPGTVRGGQGEIDCEKR